MGKAEGELDPDSTFWDTFAIKIGKKELVINTDRPEGELQYLFLLGHKRVANSIDKVTPSTDYVLINKEAEAEQIYNKLNNCSYYYGHVVGKDGVITVHDEPIKHNSVC